MLTTNVLPLAAFMVFAGRLGDQLGLRRVFLAGALVFIPRKFVPTLCVAPVLCRAVFLRTGQGGRCLSYIRKPTIPHGGSAVPGALAHLDRPDAEFAQVASLRDAPSADSSGRL